MERRRSLSELPEDVMLRIFDDIYLTNKDAIQFSLLSKHMLSVMQKRPNLVFVYDSSPMKRYSEELDYIHSTLDKYYREDIPLQSLTLKAYKFKAYKLAQSVFEAKSLVELELVNCVLQPLNTVSWPKLKRLSLNGGCVANQEVLENMFRGSPCIEILKVETLDFEAKFEGGYKVANLANLKQLEIKFGHYKERLEVSQVPNLESIVFTCYNGLLDLPDTEYPNLKTIDAGGITEHAFTNFAFKFPMLENLYVKKTRNRDLSLRIIDVSSMSLKEIRLIDMAALRVASFDVPSLVRFTYKNKNPDFVAITGTDKIVPKLLSFTGNSSGWSSSIDLDPGPSYLYDSWFQDLNRFLVQLNGSETSITFWFDASVEIMLFGDLADSITSVPKINDFSISAEWSSLAYDKVSQFLRGLFLICQPRKVTFLDCDDHKFHELLYDKLMKSRIPRS